MSGFGAYMDEKDAEEREQSRRQIAERYHERLIQHAKKVRRIYEDYFGECDCGDPPNCDWCNVMREQDALLAEISAATKEHP